MQISQMVHHYHKGYTFEAETNGQVFTVTVPIGGVEEGQKFSVPFPSDFCVLPPPLPSAWVYGCIPMMGHHRPGYYY